MGLLTVLKKLKQKEKTLRLLMLYVPRNVRSQLHLPFRLQLTMCHY